MTPKPLIYALDDEGGWGRDLFTETIRRGWDGELFKSARQIQKADYIFMRLDQRMNRLSSDRLIMQELVNAGHKLIPEWETGRLYEDKWGQAETYKEWMPKTWLLTTASGAESLLDQLPYPIVSKSRTGSASMNVRMLQNADQARAELKAVFSNGLAVPHRRGERVQRNYLIWQEFLEGNPYDYRVCITGRMCMLLRRRNRDDVPFASGSGRTEPVEELDEEAKQVLEFSTRFFFANKLHWCGIDVVRDPKTKEWKMLETTLGWKQSAYHKCRYFNSDGVAQCYCGFDMWRLLCDEIEEGVFG